MGGRFALIVACDRFADAGLSGLLAPSNDAEALAQVLRDPARGGFEVTTLLNEPKHVVEVQLHRFFNGRRSDDLLLFYFSGHGVKDDEGSLYLATSNTELDVLSATGVPASYVDQRIIASRSRSKVLLLDCCYSGAFRPGGASKAGLGVGACVDTRERFDGHGYVVLTASDALQYSFEGDVVEGQPTHSVYTRALVDGLTSGAADVDCDGNVTVDELAAYLDREVPAREPRQRPKRFFLASHGQILLARSPYTPPPPPGPDKDGVTTRENVLRLERAISENVNRSRAVVYESVNEWVGLIHSESVIASSVAKSSFEALDARPLSEDVTSVESWQLVRWYLGRLLLRTGSTIPVPTFSRLVTHKDEETSLNACDALADILKYYALRENKRAQADISAQLVGALERALHHESVRTRNMAFTTMLWIDHPAASEILLAAIRDGRVERNEAWEISRRNSNTPQFQAIAREIVGEI